MATIKKPTRVKAYKQNSSNFAELTFAEQAKSITMRINLLGREINAHIKRSVKEGRLDKANSKEKWIENIKNMIQRLEQSKS